MRRAALIVGFISVCALLTGSAPAPGAIELNIIETRAIELTQTVTVNDIPEGTRRLRMWVPIPSDGRWQRVLDRKVESAPGTWRLVRQEEGRGEFIYVEVANPEPGSASVVVSCVVERQGVHFPIDSELAHATGSIQPDLYPEYLFDTAPLMEVDTRVQDLANEICGDETDVAKQAVMLLKAVAEVADHYSKDPSKPHCGRGAAEDCLDNGGGCCTDLHSLFIALARARDVPARMQFGYRTLDNKVGQVVDPGYRCWIEFFVPGTGWVPNDIVASDNDDPANPCRWGSLSSTRLWLWEGRSFDLTPRSASGPVHTMLCGWAELDGKPIEVLPAEDGTPSKLRRTIEFEVLSNDRGVHTPALPQ